MENEPSGPPLKKRAVNALSFEIVNFCGHVESISKLLDENKLNYFPEWSQAQIFNKIRERWGVPKDVDLFFFLPDQFQDLPESELRSLPERTARSEEISFDADHFADRAVSLYLVPPAQLLGLRAASGSTWDSTYIDKFRIEFEPIPGQVPTSDDRDLTEAHWAPLLKLFNLEAKPFSAEARSLLESFGSITAADVDRQASMKPVFPANHPGRRIIEHLWVCMHSEPNRESEVDLMVYDILTALDPSKHGLHVAVQKDQEVKQGLSRRNAEGDVIVEYLFKPVFRLVVCEDWSLTNINTLAAKDRPSAKQPQIALQGIAATIHNLEIDPTRDVPVAQVRVLGGRYWTFYSGFYGTELLRAVKQWSEVPAQKTIIYKFPGDDVGFDFLDPNHRKLIVGVLDALFSRFDR